jgi:DNA-binding transcriptional MerR regulator
MFTVSQLAERCGLSRSAVLYYESVGLLAPAARSASNYRRYGDKDLNRLRLICAYRSAGLKIEDIKSILNGPSGAAAGVLQRRLVELSGEIERLHDHQRSILKLLGNKNALRRNRIMTKDKWVSIMRAAGFTEDDMRRWHAEFERSAPDDHQEFLQYLQIPADEIRSIREWSRKAAQ